MTRPPVRPRRGFTLIELLIVLGLIVLLAALAVMFLPNLDRNKGVPNATTQLQGWVRLAKNQALRDAAPRGIRLIQDPTDPTRVTALQYIEQPEPLAPRGAGLQVVIQTPWTNPGPPPYPNPNPAQATLTKPDPNTGMPVPTNWDDPNNQQIAPGDFLELSASPHLVARITGVTAAGQAQRATLVLDRPVDGTDPPPYGVPLILSDGFRIIRAPRPLAGEPLLQMHRDVFIDLKWCFPCPINLGPQTAPPNPTPYGNYTTYYQPWTPSGPMDILFNSSGQVASAPTGQIILCVQHVDRPNDRLLVVIFTRTGKVSAVNWWDVPNSDPYLLARDGRGSGL